MNSRAKKYILIISLTTFFIYSFFILGTNMGEGIKLTADNVVGASALFSQILIFAGGLFSLIYYNFLYNKRKRQLFEQFTINKKTHILIPIIGIYSGLFLADILIIVTSVNYLPIDTDYYGNFITSGIYLKYLIIPFSVVMMIFSRNFLKFIPICVIAIVAFIQFYISNPFETTSASTIDYMVVVYRIIIVIIIDIIALYIAFKVEEKYKRNHNDSFINAAYYMLGIIFFIIIFRNLFIIIAPYSGQGTITFGDASIRIGAYLVVLIVLIIFVFVDRQKFNLKRILVLFSPFVILTFIAVVVINFHNPHRVNCDAMNYSKKDSELVFSNSFLADNVYLEGKISILVQNQNTKCYNDDSSSSFFYTGELDSNYLYASNYEDNRIVRLTSNKEFLKELYENIESQNDLPSFLVEHGDEKYALIYIPDNRIKEKADIIERVNSTGIKKDKIIQIDFDMLYKIYEASLKYKNASNTISYSSLSYSIDATEEYEEYEEYDEDKDYKEEDYFWYTIHISDKLNSEIQNVIDKGDKK